MLILIILIFIILIRNIAIYSNRVRFESALHGRVKAFGDGSWRFLTCNCFCEFVDCLFPRPTVFSAELLEPKRSVYPFT